MILILGSGGQVGRALLSQLGSRGHGLDLPEIDLARPESVAEKILALKPEAVINAAAYTAVDRAESEPDLARRINTEAPERIAGACRKLGAPFVHFSTDYVFDGSGEQAWKEDDATGPLNTYGRTKLEGERAIEATGGNFLILRTSWIYAREGHNFVKTMLKLGAEREELKVVNDQVGAPTYAPHLARATLEALEARGQGVFHLCSAGTTSWFQFAQAIFENARAKGYALKVRSVQGIPSKDYPTPARRPSNSRLSTDKIAQMLGVRMPHWNQGLVEFFREGGPA